MTGTSATPDGDLLQRRDRAFGRGAKLFYDEPLHLVGGEGASLFDKQGRRYVDMYNNVPCVGHAHPRIVEAMARQQATLNTHSRYLSEPAIALAERLTALQRVTESGVFSCSGTEAIEIALRMAQLATGQHGIVCTNHTYHGNNTVVGALTNLPAGDTRHLHIRSIPFPETLRPLAPGEGLADAYVARLKAAIEELKSTGQGFAALILCPIFANEGLPDIPATFMAKAAALVSAEGGLIIADEVQAGYGRTGTWWGYDEVGLTPDIVVTGKPMGAGLPLAATCAKREVVEQFRAETRYFNTFAASPLQGAVGLAVLDVIEEEGLVEHSRTLGGELQDCLKQRLGNTPGLIDVRGKGLFLAAEFVDADGNPDAAHAFSLVCALRREGFLTSVDGAFNNCVKIRPPLVLPRADALAFLDAFDRVTHA
ncbi:aspartate aminotransferase family protein [Novosphingobium sediminis]|uniref:Aspartate aminotransferase family protein n=1 Tax=Novosphingobium sediminis TaxID=707214 RepID=A0A512AL45_9SPHN|nr:aminotransferase class III-fold pyridoxal phosphate-dependent enzyme [Novosphingobium sediminis]GEO00435.1 aspartate aminotransferase family protein [Novosphingobium sediminis]